MVLSLMLSALASQTTERGETVVGDPALEDALPPAMQAHCAEEPCAVVGTVVGGVELNPGHYAGQTRWTIETHEAGVRRVLYLQARTYPVAGANASSWGGALSAKAGTKILIVDRTLIEGDMVRFEPTAIFVSDSRFGGLVASTAWGFPVDLSEEGVRVLTPNDLLPTSSAQWREAVRSRLGVGSEDAIPDELRLRTTDEIRIEAWKTTWREGTTWQALVTAATTPRSASGER